MSGRCNICGHAGEFLDVTKDREGYICANCGTSSRHRALVYALGYYLGFEDNPAMIWETQKNIKVLESSGRSSYPMVFRGKFSYYNTEFDPSRDEMNRPYTEYADFQKLAYPDNELDIVIASEVFEHVREHEKGFGEVYRVLKDRGLFLMTVPYVHEWAETQTRVKVEGDKDIHLLPPEYHGGGGQTLSYRTFGRDVMKRLRGLGFTVGLLEAKSEELGILPQFVFLAQKGDYIELKHFVRNARRDLERTRPKAGPLILFRLFLTLKYNTLSIGHFWREIIRKSKDRF
jgi:SAM-dependent methyltransferase